jgi:hypothetical protein
VCCSTAIWTPNCWCAHASRAVFGLSKSFSEGANTRWLANCALHDPGAYNQCREPNAERVSDRERANRCEWFTPRSGDSGPLRDPKAGAQTALDALFKPKKP